MKNRARVLGLVCGAIVAASVAAMTGCSTTPESAGTSAETIRSTNVALSVQDGSGAEIGSGSGILIAPKLVLTAAHLVAGQTSWTVRTADGKTAHGSRGVTYDWLAYGNDKAHPQVNDLAVIYLDDAIQLPAYPHAASAAMGAGASATRVHGEGSVFTNVSSKLGEVAAFPHSYVTAIPSGEALVTGGAVLNDHNEIIGIVTGKGLTTGNLYIARTDGCSSWVGDESNTCDANPSTPTTPTPAPVSTSTSSSSSSGVSSSGDIVVKTYTPPVETTSSSSSSSGSSSSSSSSSGTPSTTSSSSSTGGPNTCTPTQPNGNCYGTSCDTTTTSSSSSSSSGSPTTSSSSSSSGSSTSSTSSSGGGDDDDDNGGANPITTPTTPVTSNSSTSSTSSTGGTPTSPTSSSSTSSTGGSCVGDCSGATDSNIDYGACPGCGVPTTGGITVK